MAKIKISDLVMPKECESFFAELKELTEQDLALVKGGLASICACAGSCGLSL
jgi:bacteriocin-like protein